MKIQVYGLQRTGTNFLEFVLRTAFTEVAYERLYKKGDLPAGHKFGKVQAVKHTLPSMAYSDRVIITSVKDYPTWKRKCNRRKIPANRKAFDAFRAAAKELPPERTMKIDTNVFAANYREGLDEIASWAGLTVATYEQPLFRFNMMMNQTDKLFRKT